MATKILRNKNSFIVFDDSLENVNEDVFDFYNKNQEKEIIFMQVPIMHFQFGLVLEFYLFFQFSLQF